MQKGEDNKLREFKRKLLLTTFFFANFILIGFRKTAPAIALFTIISLKSIRQGTEIWILSFKFSFQTRIEFMVNQELIEKKFGFLGKELLKEVMKNSQYVEIPADKEILREGQYIKVIPLVIEGAIKVFTRYKEKELLLYYIRPDESCIMSFAASMKNEPSKVFAITEVNTIAILLPISKIELWFNNYPQFNSLFFNLYNDRYIDMLDTINHLLFNKLDQRVLLHLQDKVEISGSKIIKTTHKQIATELGTAREVISRIIKKLEKEDMLVQQSDGILVL